MSKKIAMLLLCGAVVLCLVSNSPHFHYEARAYPPTEEELEPLIGVLASNKLLQSAHKMAKGNVSGPDTVVPYGENDYLAMTTDGYINFVNSQGEVENLVFVGGRPLSAKLSGSVLYICEAVKGLVSFDLVSKELKIVSNQVTADKSLIAHANDLDLAQDGKIYFTDSTVIPPFQGLAHYETLPSTIMALISGSQSGRLLCYDAVTKVTSVLIDGLEYGNGVALGPNEEFVLVVDTFAHKIYRYWLKGLKSGTTDIFTNLPLLLDNLSRGKRGFWLSVIGEYSPFVQNLRNYAWLRALLLNWLTFYFTICPVWRASLPAFMLFELSRPTGYIVKLDFNGEVLETLQDPTGNSVHQVTNVVETNGKLIIGMPEPDFFAIYDLAPEG